MLVFLLNKIELLLIPMKKNLPQYTHSQEVWNSLTHLAGVLFSIGVFIFFLVTQISRNLSFSYMYPFYIYVFFMFVVFAMSTIYHASPLNSKLRGVCRVIDHADIYLFVAGTYTPLCINAITNHSIGLGLIISEYALALIGIIITVFWLNNKAMELVGYIIYLIAGWALMFVYPFNQCLENSVFIWILIGGIVYTIGAIAYGIGKKNNVWFHTIFHVFIVAGAVLQFIGVFNILGH